GERASVFDAMKNEFKFDSFALTTKAKHYFSIITGQEGQLKSDPELEVKGVSLRTSNIPPVVMKEFKRTIKELCEIVARGDKIKILPLLEKVAAIEHVVVDSIRAGKAGYLKTTNVKDRSAYSEDDEKSYHYHRMYNAIFGPKYGYLDEPPYDAVKLPVNLENKTAVKEWLENIKDPMIKTTATRWFEENNYRTYRTLILPEFLVENFGIPPELI
ncbi:family B DNA polymerase, partial [Salmonella enterica]|uniref:family B DNA polymerase n=1 Tax=Salmonella enterica TaxID=28901 RepID=UPI003EDC8C64